MNKVFFCLALWSGSLYAATITCEGDYAGYHAHMAARSAGLHLVGMISVTLTDGSGGSHAAKLTPTSSAIRLRHSLQFSGSGPQGNGAVSALYDASSDSYSGTLDAQTSLGEVTIAVICHARGSGFASRAED